MTAKVLGMAVGASEAEAFSVEFLRKLKRGGLAGVKLVIPDAHEGIKAAVARVFRATCQRCRVGLLKNPAVSSWSGAGPNRVAVGLDRVTLNVRRRPRPRGPELE